jgi:hypothetical protein
MQSSVAYALALIMAIAGVAGMVGLTTTSASAQSASVSVTCSDAIGGGSTECVISAPGADQLSVPSGNVCATVTGTSGSFDGSAWVSPAGSPTLSFTFNTPVVLGEGGSYQVTSGGVTTTVVGPSILCGMIELPAEPETEIQLPVDEAPAPVDQDEIGGNGNASAVPPAPQESGTDAATTDSTVPPAAADAPAEGTDLPIEPAAVIVDPETTPETGLPADPVTVTVVAYVCDADPGTVDPATAGCSLASGLTFHASDSSGNLGSQSTDGSGTVSYASTAGSTFIVYQANLLSGYRPTGDGRYEVQQLSGDLTITVVNVVRAELGRLQIVAGLCPTSTESRTEFTIADQSHFSTASLDACGANPGSVFTVASDALPGGAWTIRTEGDGAWRGHVPAGVYTVTASDGTVSAPIVVVANAVSVAVAVTYVNQPQGTLDVQHVLCTAGTDGEYIAVNPAGSPDASCSPAEGMVTVTDELSGESSSILIAGNGSTPVALKPGLYRVTGPQGIASDLVTITAEQTSVVRISTVITTGSLMISSFECPAGSNSAPADPATTCAAPFGSETLTLTGPSGTKVMTSGNGLATLNGLLAGSYSISGTTVCAVQSESGADASSFSILAGQTTMVRVYHCVPTDGTGGGQNGGVSGPGNGDGTGGVGNPVGGGSQTPTGGDGTNPNQYTAGVGGEGTEMDGTGGAAQLGVYASNSHLLVRGLPAAGSGSTSPSNLWWPILLLTSSAGLALIGRRQQQLARQRVRRDR